MIVSATASVTVGFPSLSVSVKVAPETLPAPWLLATVPVTVVERSGSSVTLSTAVIGTESEALVVSPAAMVIAASAPTV